MDALLKKQQNSKLLITKNKGKFTCMCSHVPKMYKILLNNFILKFQRSLRFQIIRLRKPFRANLEMRRVNNYGIKQLL